jgi:hypothetical protein
VSNSPKFSIIELSFDLAAADRAGRQRRAAASHEREAQRAAEFQRRSADRAQRAAGRERAAVSARLDEVSAMVTAVPDGAPGMLARDAQALAADIAGLQERIRTGGDLTACLREAESLRGRALGLGGRAQASAGQAGRRQVIDDLRARLAAPGTDAAKLEPLRYARCAELLGKLEEAATQQGVRFEALHGTADHEIAAYVEQSTEVALAARAKLEEATDRLEVVRAAAESALQDARAFCDDELAETLRTTLADAVAALATGQDDPAQAGTALAEVGRLAELLPAAEARLDELAVAHERRAAFAETLKGVLADQGMSFLGASDTGDRFILQFERPGGALYTAAVDDGEDNELQLSYAIDGEADVPVLPEPGKAVCDQTEAFLEAIHADLAPSGYEAGELDWDGKPDRGTRSARTRHTRQDAARQRRLRESP